MMEAERFIRAVLDGEVVAGINDQRLTLQNAYGSRLQFIAAE